MDSLFCHSILTERIVLLLLLLLTKSKYVLSDFLFAPYSIYVRQLSPHKLGKITYAVYVRLLRCAQTCIESIPKMLLIKIDK